MALPVTISGTATGAQNSYHGPFKSSTGGSFYTILIESTGLRLITAWKATDPTSSFTEQDGANSPRTAVGNDFLSVGIFPVGDNLHGIGQSDDNDVYYFRFLTDDGSASEDTWIDIDGAGDRDILIESPGTAQTARACTIAVRGDGDIVVAYNGDSDMVMGTEFDRIDWNVSTDAGVTWAGPVSIDNGGLVNWTGAVIVPGSSDRMHVFFMDNTNFDGYQRTIRSDDSLETFPSAFDIVISISTIYSFHNGVSYDDAGTQRVRCPYRDLSEKASIAKLDSSDTPTLTTDVNVSDDTVRAVNSQFTGTLAVDVKNLQLLYSSVEGDSDLFRDTNDDDAGWGTDTEELDGVTVNHISSRVYDRSGTDRLAFIYDDGGTVKYNEINLAAMVVPTIPLTMAPYVPAGR